MKLLVGNRWSEFFFLVIFSEFIVKCVIRFGRFVRILEDLWKCYKEIIIFNVQQNRVVHRPEDFFIPANGFGVVNLFS
jgi:hypothetical protein